MCRGRQQASWRQALHPRWRCSLRRAWRVSDLRWQRQSEQDGARTRCAAELREPSRGTVVRRSAANETEKRSAWVGSTTRSERARHTRRLQWFSLRRSISRLPSRRRCRTVLRKGSARIVWNVLERKRRVCSSRGSCERRVLRIRISITVHALSFKSRSYTFQY